MSSTPPPLRLPRVRALAAWTAAPACDHPPRPVHLATAHQAGPVAYRDPAGGVSPDGRLLAYTQGRELLVRDLAGDEVRVLGVAPRQIRYVAWYPESDRVLVHERSFDRRRQGWFVYDVESGAKRTFWGGNLPPDLPSPSMLLELSWAPDGRSLVGVVRGARVSRVWRIAADGRTGEVVAESPRLSHPVVSPTGEVGCVERYGGLQHLRHPCSQPRIPLNSAVSGGPVTVADTGPDSIRPSLAQIAPAAAQSVVPGSVSVISSPEDGRTRTATRRFSPCVTRFASTSRPFVISSAPASNAASRSPSNSSLNTIWKPNSLAPSCAFGRPWNAVRTQKYDRRSGHQ